MRPGTMQERDARRREMAAYLRSMAQRQRDLAEEFDREAGKWERRTEGGEEA